MSLLAASGVLVPTPSPTPALNIHTWLDPVFPWRTGVIIGSAIILMAVVVLIARHRERARRR
jgi:hypothetical protein